MMNQTYVKLLTDQIVSVLPGHRPGRRSLNAVALALLFGLSPLRSAVAQATPPAAPGTSPAAPAQPPAAAPQGPPLPVLLGYATFMLIADRPFIAEQIYKAILAHDPKNPAALAGLHKAKMAERPTLILLGNSYRDTIENRMFTYGGGPTFRTRYGKITFLAGTGYYEDVIHANQPNETLGILQTDIDNHALGKSTINLILEPYLGNYQGYIFLNRTFYAGAPSRTLFNIRLSDVPNLRESYSIFFARSDSFLQSIADPQNLQFQFFPPETYYAVASGLTSDTTAFDIAHPLGDGRSPWDGELKYGFVSYSDGNTRNIVNTQLFYRLLPKRGQPMPIFRVGLQNIYDDTRLFGIYYFTPQHSQQLSLALNFVVVAPKFQFIVFGTYPFEKIRGSSYGRYSPLVTLFTAVSYNITDETQLFVKLTNGRRTGNSAAFTDFVFGITQRL